MTQTMKLTQAQKARIAELMIRAHAALTNPGMGRFTWSESGLDMTIQWTGGGSFCSVMTREDGRLRADLTTSRMYSSQALPIFEMALRLAFLRAGG